MKRSHKRITYVTYAGVLPFYVSHIIGYYDNNEILVRFSNINTISSLYAALIVCFLSGMQWQQIIYHKRKNQLFIPFIPLFMVLTYNQNFFYNYSSFILVLSLIFSLGIDIMLLKDILEDSFKKLRIKATFLALISFFL